MLLGVELVYKRFIKAAGTQGFSTQNGSYSLDPLPLMVTAHPLSGSTAVVNGQTFTDLNEILFHQDPEVVLNKGDELESPTGEPSRILHIERFRQGLLPHAEIYTCTSQWKRT